MNPILNPSLNPITSTSTSRTEPAADYDYDVIVIGGSYAGLSGALQLARARRRLLVVDAGQRRNRFAGNSHGFLTRDGQPAAAIAAEGRTQLAAYPTVRFHDGMAVDARPLEARPLVDRPGVARPGVARPLEARPDADGFIVTLDNGASVSAARLLLATGVRDELPPVPGLAERWGKSVFHCPYCHGYELDEGRIGVLANGPMSLHHAQMLPHWGRVTLFTNDTCPLDAAQQADLDGRGVKVEHTRVERIDDAATVVLADGRRIVMDGLFTFGRLHMASPIAAQLGCVLDDGPLGSLVRTDETRQTTMPGVFAAGDAIRNAGNVAMAVADGSMAGVGVHRSLLFGIAPFSKT